MTPEETHEDRTADRPDADGGSDPGSGGDRSSSGVQPEPVPDTDAYPDVVLPESYQDPDEHALAQWEHDLGFPVPEHLKPLLVAYEPFVFTLVEPEHVQHIADAYVVEPDEHAAD